MISRRKLIKISAAASLAPGLARPAIAQAGWPNRPVRILIPFTPGGGADTIARLVAIKMTEVLGQQFIVESKPGAGGNIAAEFTARSAPDGYTMFLAGDHHATNNHLNPNLNYDAVRDFEPVSLVVQYPVAIAVPSNSPSKTVAHFIERAKAEPGKLTYGTPGHGAIPHRAVRAPGQDPNDQRALPRRGAGHSGPASGPDRLVLE
jgi:tripartite-type tricarboxylate transporter receptor subunit TctC